jgi:hypothetical protein
MRKIDAIEAALEKLVALRDRRDETDDYYAEMSERIIRLEEELDQAYEEDNARK